MTTSAVVPLTVEEYERLMGGDLDAWTAFDREAREWLKAQRAEKIQKDHEAQARAQARREAAKLHRFERSTGGKP
jgi:hypothetical protein